jgi:hypothetical protein
MSQVFRHLALFVSIGTLLAVGGCGRSPQTSNNKTKVQQVSKGMTVQQVEQILGKPISVLNMPAPPPLESRQYQGYTDQEGDHRIDVDFDSGVVIRVIDMVPKKSRW